MEQVVSDSGHGQTFAARRHIRVPADDHSPVFVATVVVRLDFADLDALNASFTAPAAVMTGFEGIAALVTGATGRDRSW